MKNDKDIRTSTKIKRLERRKAEEIQRYGKHRFAEEFSEEPISTEQLDEDIPDDEI